MRLIEALAEACQGREKSLGLDLLGSFGDKELNRILRDERRPTFELLEAAFDAAPDALFDYVRERYGVKVEKPAQPIAAQLELFAGELHSLSARITEALERQKAQDRVARVEPQGRLRGRA